MTKCVFCGVEESSYKGVNQINNDGSISYFCSSKCRKNALKLRRDKSKLKWTEAYRIGLQRAAAKVERAKAAEEAKNSEKKK